MQTINVLFLEAVLLKKVALWVGGFVLGLGLAALSFVIVDLYYNNLDLQYVASAEMSIGAIVVGLIVTLLAFYFPLREKNRSDHHYFWCSGAVCAIGVFSLCFRYDENVTRGIAILGIGLLIGFLSYKEANH